MDKKKLINLIIGPVLFAVCSLTMGGLFTPSGARAIGTLCWMVYWWATRPVHMTVTALLPIMINGLFPVIDMSVVTAQYFSDSIILILGSSLLTIPWAATGLDRRVALKILSLVGPSMKSQIAVWMFTSMILSTTLPNVAVCALLTPIAVAMLHAAGYEDIAKAAPAVPILVCIGWGVGLGGVGSPLGGAMNVAAISFFEEAVGHEFMYVDWVVRVLPYFIIVGIVMFLVLVAMYARGGQRLDGTKEFFNQSYAALGPIKRDEKICATLFVLAVIAAFTRPLYAKLLPGLAPAFVFVILGSLSFFITAADKKHTIMDWEDVQKNALWGMMLLFGGGLALGKMVNLSGAGDGIASIMTSFNLDGGFTTCLILVVFGTLISELTNSTVSAAVVVPIALGFATKLGLNPLPYWLITILGYNAEFLLPISVRAIPVGYGLDANKMMKHGIPVMLIRMLTALIVGYACLKLWPGFSVVSYL